MAYSVLRVTTEYAPRFPLNESYAMNIVMIGPFAFTPKGTVSARAFFAARALVKRGHRVTILMPPYDNLADSGREWARDGVQLVNMVIRRVTPITPVTVALAMARRALALKPDVIHVFKPIGYSGLAGHFLSESCPRAARARPRRLGRARRLGRHQSVPALVAMVLYPARSGHASPRARHHRRQPDVADAGVGNGHRPGARVLRPQRPGRIAADTARRISARRAQIRAELGVGDAPLAIYLGQIPHGNDLDQALDALERVLPRIPDLRLAILGTGDGLPALRADVERRGLERAVILDRLGGSLARAGLPGRRRPGDLSLP